MDRLKIDGGVPLTGEIAISGAKNAALPLMAAGLVTDGTLRLTNVPDLVDTRSMAVLLGHHGLEVGRDGDCVTISGDVTNIDAPYDWCARCGPQSLFSGRFWRVTGRPACRFPADAR